MRIAVAIGALLGACYSPRPSPGAPCAASLACPDPLVCVGGLCVEPGTPQPDAPRSDAPRSDASRLDAPRLLDAPPDAALPQPMLVQQNVNKVAVGADVAATLPSLPAAGDLLVMVGAANGGALTSVTGGGVTWMKAASSPDNANIELWYGITDGSSATVTIARTANTNNMWLSVSEWSGMATTNVLDNAAAQSGLTATALSPSLATTHAHDLLIFGVADEEPGVSYGAAMPGTWTAMTGVGTVDNVQASWYRVVATTNTYAASVSASGAGWDAAIAAFAAAN